MTFGKAVPAIVLLAALAAGCGDKPSGDGTADASRRTRPAPTAPSTPSTPEDHRCPGEDPSPARVKADAFGGYPDGTGCAMPSGGHEESARRV